MAEKIINNPSLLPGDLAFELSGNTITAISGHPIAGSGSGTVSDLVYYPVFDNSNGNVTFHLGSSAHGPEPGGAWHISGATGPQGIQGEQGIQGIQGIPGVDGKNPVFEINSSDAHWRWKYTEATSGWTDLGVVASGAVGPKGQDGTNGVTPGIRINTSTNKWEIAADGTTWVSTDVNATGPAGQNGTNGTNGTDGKDGKDGTNGKDGFSPAVSTEAVTAEGHPQGGTKVTITDLEHQSGQEFYVWNGTNGQGATVNLLDGDGIHITQSSNDYTIGVSANYSAMAVTWVQTQNYLKSVPDTYALKTDVEAASANAYDKAVAEIPSVTNFITKDVNNLTYYYTTSETSSTSEISNALSTKLDSTVAAQTYQTKTDMANYLTTSDASTTYQPKGNYVTTSDISDMATQTWVESKNYLIQSDLNSYATKTYVETASANAYNEAVAQIPSVTNFITKDVNNLTNYYDKTESDGRYMQKNTDSTLSGDGTTNTPLGIDTTDMDDNKQYAFTTTGWEEVQGGGGGGETNIIESIRLEGDSADVTITNKKATIPLATASATGVAGNTGVITKDDKAHLDAAVEYKENPYDSSSPKALIPQQMFVCESDQQIIDIVTNHTDLINGKGTIFFRITGI